MKYHEQGLKLAGLFNIVPDIHQNDFIFKFQESLASDSFDAIEKYYRVGRYSANLVVKEILKEISRIKRRFKI